MLREIIGRIFGPRKREKRPSISLLETCLNCNTDLTSSELYLRYRVCPECGFNYVLPAYDRIATLADEGTFQEINRSVASLDPLPFKGEASYKKRITDAQRMTGLPEAVVTGVCQIEGTLTVIVVLDFSFLGGAWAALSGKR